MKLGPRIEFCVNSTLAMWRPVEGYIVNVAPHLSATFAVHRCPWHPNRWKVSDVETGSSVSPRLYTTRAMAVFKAEIVLRNKSEADLLKAWRSQPAWVRAA